jgi:crossover junction endodeoxyribonuclease RuvC
LSRSRRKLILAGMFLCGIDPGTVGAFAVVDDTGEVVGIGDLPTHTVARANGRLKVELDSHGFAQLLREARVQRVIIEQVSAMPRQGVSSTFRFGYAAGTVYGVVAALGLPMNFVTPQKWQQHHRIRKGPDDAVRKVLQLYPALHENLKRKKDQHRADAVLIALYGLAMLQATRPGAELPGDRTIERSLARPERPFPA